MLLDNIFNIVLPDEFIKLYKKMLFSTQLANKAWDWERMNNHVSAFGLISSDTVDQVSFFLPLFIHCSVHSLKKPLKSHRRCLQANKPH